MHVRSNWVAYFVTGAVFASGAASCAVGDELDPAPFEPASDDAAIVDSTSGAEIGAEDGGFVFDTGAAETAVPSEAGAETDVDTGIADDGGIPETDVPDTLVADTYIEPDTYVADTYVEPDTYEPDTYVPDTYVEPDTFVPDTYVEPDTYVPDTYVEPDTYVADTYVPDTYVPPPPGPPTVSFTAPANNTSIAYNKVSDACQGRSFSVSFDAPAGLKSMQWKFFTPNAASASTSMLGTCTGAAAYGYFVDPTKFTGTTSATVVEDVAVAGLYSGSAGSGRWWWCTAPGTSPTSFVSSPPAPGTAGLQTLSNYCSAKTTPPPSDLGSRWRLEVTVVDSLGKTAVANLYFWVHQ